MLTWKFTSGKWLLQCRFERSVNTTYAIRTIFFCISHNLAVLNETPLMLELDFFFLNEQRPTSVHLHCRVFPVKASFLWPATIYTATEEIRIYAGFLFQPSMELRSLYLHFIRSSPNEMTVSPQRADDEVPYATVRELVRWG